MRINKTLRSFYWSVVFFSVTLPSVAAATSAMDSVTGGLSTTANTAGFGATPVPLTTMVGGAMNVVFSLVGILLLGFIIYAGFLYFIDAGGEKSAKKAKEVLTTSIIGLVIIIAAYAITRYIMTALEGVVG